MVYRRRFETGPWFSVGQPLDGREVHQRLAALASARSATRPPYAVYVHVPFCAAICSFCALYTFGANANADERFDEYLCAVLRSLDSHPWSGAGHAPTTVHFGGGTPLHIGMPRFARLVRALRAAFGNSPDCEWAIETTTSSLDAVTVDALEALGFRRIHLGIQTLDDRARFRVGRRDSGAAALERVRALEARGLATSIDLILGLDGVGRSIVHDDLRRLHDAGVRMFSICELRERAPNAMLAGVDDPVRAQRNFSLWKTVWDFMESVGLVPIHVGQFATSPSDNLYFTHPARGEDCLAVGPYAHGSAGNLSYSNLLLPEYYESINHGATPIASGVHFEAAEATICALERDLLTHCVSSTALVDVTDAFPTAFEHILDRWFANDLLRRVPGTPGHFRLSMNGSWFVGNMIAEARGLADSSVAALVAHAF